MRGLPGSTALASRVSRTGTNETRIKVSETLRKMRKGEPDLVRLRRLAEERWLGGRSSGGTVREG
jgi:hypothetical protein